MKQSKSQTLGANIRTFILADILLDYNKPDASFLLKWKSFEISYSFLGGMIDKAVRAITHTCKRKRTEVFFWHAAPTCAR